MTELPRVAPRWLLLLLSIVWSVRAEAAPEITALSLRGLQTGAITTLVVDGRELLPAPRLVLPVPVAAQRLREGSTPNRIILDVALAPEVPPGIYPLRLATPRGISNPLLLGVDELPQLPFAERAEALPVAFSGVLSGGTTLRTSFAGKKGQRIVIDCEARRLGAAWEPLVSLLNARQVPIAYSQGQAVLTGDARLATVLPADGTYTVEVRDVLYRAGSPGHFRLKIGDLRFADLAHPLGLQRGTRRPVELIGNLPPGFRVTAEAGDLLGEFPAPLPHGAGLTGGPPRLLVGDLPVTVEAEQPADKLQEVTAPAVLCGRIAQPGEEDRYRLLVPPGRSLRFDVIAHRAGSPLDGVLVLRNEAEAQLATADDRDDALDPSLEYKVPDDVKAVVVVLRDLHARGGRDFVYRLAVVPLERSDFILTVTEDRANIPQGGTAVLRLQAARLGYDGPIQLRVPELPPGITLSGDTIPAGATETLLTMTAPSDAPLMQALGRVLGEVADPKRPLRRLALRPAAPGQPSQAWLRADLGLALVPPAPLTVAWDTTDPLLPLGQTYAAKVKVQRAAGVSGPVRLSLRTSQVVPRTKDNKQEDLDRALRAQSPLTLAADQAEGTLPVLVPADLAAIPYDLVVQAELLSADGRSVVSTASTPSRRLHVGPPLRLQLAVQAVEARAGQGPTGKLTGKVERLGGFHKPVTLLLTGLPPDLPTPALVVAADRSDFEFAITFPYGSKPGELPNVKLVAEGGEPPIRSEAVPVTVKVVPGDPPPPPPPLLALFEDDPAFVALLTEGDGRAVLEQTERYSGEAALRVTPSQRFRTRLPGGGYKIAEKPGPGEYRYLRFAWKKRGGDNILLQLNANGNWGPARDQQGPAYRYEAGPALNPLNVAAVRLAEQLPTEWTVVTRDLFADFGAFTLTGIAFTPGNGEYALFDHVYLARSAEDLQGTPPARTAPQRK